MKDKRPVDELSIEELERILAIRKREDRMKRLKRMERSGRVITRPEPNPVPSPRTAAQPMPPDSSALPAQTIAMPAGTATRGTSAPRFEEDVAPTEYAGKSKREGEAVWRRFVSRSLLLVEVAAVVGLFAIGAFLLHSIGVLQSETASAQSAVDTIRREGLPTIEPTPVLRLSDVVLPSGHIPVVGGEPEFNYSEVPSHMQHLVREQVLQPVISRPPPTSETALRVIIPSIAVDATIVQGIDWDALRLGVGQYQNGVNPTDVTGNVVLAGHNDIYGEIFRYLPDLEVGDQFQIHTQTRILTYVITQVQYVEPSAVHVMDNRAGPTVTLISCYPYGISNQRVVVFADRVDV